MTRTRSLCAAAVLALAVPTTIAACGGDDGADEDPQEVVDATFSNDEQITSGVLNLDLEVSAGDQGAFSASLEGPFQTDPDNPGAPPQIGLTGTLGGEAAGQSIDFEGGVTITEDNAFVEYSGQAYEVGTEAFSQVTELSEAATETEEGETPDSFQEACEQGVELQGGDPSACDFDINAWLTDLTNEGTEDVAGTETVHVSGALDVDQMLQDVTGIAGGLPNGQKIDEAQIEEAAGAISEATFDVYSGTDDDLLRKFDLNLTIDPSAVGATPVPVEALDLGLSAEVSEVNEDQTIEAPSDAQPIEELFGQLGGLGALGGSGLELPGGGSGGDSGLDDLGGAGGSSDAYFECITEAGNDADAIEACASEL